MRNVTPSQTALARRLLGEAWEAAGDFHRAFYTLRPDLSADPEARTAFLKRALDAGAIELVVREVPSEELAERAAEFGIAERATKLEAAGKLSLALKLFAVLGSTELIAFSKRRSGDDRYYATEAIELCEDPAAKVRYAQRKIRRGESPECLELLVANGTAKVQMSLRRYVRLLVALPFDRVEDEASATQHFIKTVGTDAGIVRYFAEQALSAHRLTSAKLAAGHLGESLPQAGLLEYAAAMIRHGGVDEFVEAHELAGLPHPSEALQAHGAEFEAQGIIYASACYIACRNPDAQFDFAERSFALALERSRESCRFGYAYQNYRASGRPIPADKLPRFVEYYRGFCDGAENAIACMFDLRDADGLTAFGRELISKRREKEAEKAFEMAARLKTV